MFMCACTQKPEEAVGSLGAAILDGYESLDMCDGNQTWILLKSCKCSSLLSPFSVPWKFLPAVNTETTADHHAETRRQLSAQL